MTADPTKEAGATAADPARGRGEAWTADMREIVYGEPYEDNSGLRWAVRLAAPDEKGKRRVWLGSQVNIDGKAADMLMPADPAMIRRLVAALNAVADALDRTRGDAS